MFDHDIGSVLFARRLPLHPGPSEYGREQAGELDAWGPSGLRAEGVPVHPRLPVVTRYFTQPRHQDLNIQAFPILEQTEVGQLQVCGFARGAVVEFSGISATILATQYRRPLRVERRNPWILDGE
jgi:hypothetical protein